VDAGALRRSFDGALPRGHPGKRFGCELPAGFDREYRERAARALTQQLRAVPGIVDVLRELTLPICVASNGDHATVRAALSSTGLLERFEGRIFSAADVARSKPAPDVFLLAAAVMGAQPHRCVVVEDTPVGVAAAVAAGMTVLGYAGRTSPERLLGAGATGVFGDMTKLARVLGSYR
jgi:HAD superfamily hydrolase (TIGR01509 family)